MASSLLSLSSLFISPSCFFTRSLSAAASQAKDLLPWFTLLVIGFGTQFGLFTYLKGLIKSAPPSDDRRQYRHVRIFHGRLLCPSPDRCPASFWPGRLSLFLTRYQVWFIGIGIISNFVGIIYLLRQINKHRVHVKI